MKIANVDENSNIEYLKIYVEEREMLFEYLENQGYIHKVTSQSNCTQNCKGCHGCDQPAITVDTWEVVKRG